MMLDYWYAPFLNERAEAVIFVHPEYRHVLKEGVFITFTEVEEERREVIVKVEEVEKEEKEEKKKPIVIYFPFNKSHPHKGEELKLKDLDKEKTYILVGHTDWIGSEQYNIKLSQRRVYSIAKELEKLDIKNLKLSWKGEEGCDYKKGGKITKRLIEELQPCRKVEIWEE